MCPVASESQRVVTHPRFTQPLLLLSQSTKACAHLTRATGGHGKRVSRRRRQYLFIFCFVIKIRIPPMNNSSSSSGSSDKVFRRSTHLLVNNTPEMFVNPEGSLRLIVRWLVLGYTHSILLFLFFQLDHHRRWWFFTRTLYSDARRRGVVHYPCTRVSGDVWSIVRRRYP